MIARWAIAPLHHPQNRYSVTDGALRRVLVDTTGYIFVAKLPILLSRQIVGDADLVRPDALRGHGQSPIRV